MTTNPASRLAVCAAIALCVQSMPAKPGSSNWQETDGGRLRIVAEPFEPGAREVRAALQVELAPGWKTYWREPGSAGIPPQVTVSGNGVGEPTIHFPVPVRVHDDSGTWSGYKAPVSLPLTIPVEAGVAPSTMEAKVFLGICHDICIPFSADLEVPLDGKPNTMQTMVVDAAFDALAPTATDNLSVESAKWSDDGQLEVSLDDTAHPERTELFLAIDGEHSFKPPQRISAEDGRSVFRAEPLFDPKTGEGLTLTIAARSGADTIETSVPLPISD